MIDADACWTEQPLCVLDFETTSPDPLTCGVVSVAVARFENRQCVGHFYSLINPRMDIPAEATAIHGVSEGDVKDAPALTDVAADIYALAKDAMPCGYNGQTFDRVILQRHIRGTDCAMFDNGWHWADPLVVVRDCDRWERGAGRHKLENVCKRHGVELDGAHNALADAIATGKLLYRLLDKGLVRPCSVGRLLLHMHTRREEQERDFQAWLAKQPKRDEHKEAG